MKLAANLVVLSLMAPSAEAQVFSQTRTSQDAVGAVVAGAPWARSWDNHQWGSGLPNGQPTTVMVPNEPWLTEWLMPFDFAFQIPSNASIVGVRVEVYAKAGLEGGGLGAVMLVNHWEIFQPPQGSPQRQWGQTLTGDYAWYTIGGLNDLWDMGVSAAEVNDGTLFFALQGGISENRQETLVDSTRMTVWWSLPCYANCDESTQAPALNVADFTCFLQKFASGNAYANCDQSAVFPTINVADFSCFLQRFAAGCP